MKTKFEQALKDKLEQFEPTGSQSRWDDLQKQMSKKPGMSGKNWLFIIGAVIISSVVIFGLLNINNDNSEIADINQITVTEKSDSIEADNNTLPIENSAIAKTNIPETRSEDETKSTSIISKPTNTVKESPSKANKPTTDTSRLQNPVNNSYETQAKTETENSFDEETIIISFKSQPQKGCIPLSVKFITNANPDEYYFTWHFNDGSTSTETSPNHIYTEIGEYEPVLILQPKTEKNKARRITGSPISCFGIQNTKINFEKNKNLYTFNTRNGGVYSYQWNINGNEFNTPEVDYEFKQDGKYRVELVLQDENTCELKLSETVDVVIEHYYAMPNAFTPSVQGMNSTFGPVYEDMENLKFSMIILDRMNQIVYETNEITKPWDGTNIKTNQDAEAGVYLWKIVTEDEYGNIRTRRGQVTLLRNN
jgi:hypothetical protein